LDDISDFEFHDSFSWLELFLARAFFAKAGTDLAKNAKIQKLGAADPTGSGPSAARWAAGLAAPTVAESQARRYHQYVSGIEALAHRHLTDMAFSCRGFVCVTAARTA
jgi:hypothetical protein